VRSGDRGSGDSFRNHKGLPDLTSFPNSVLTSFLLNNSTVTSKGGGNVLLGGAGLNLFFGNSKDQTDRIGGETFISV
jgi:hypothetical protein